MGSDGDDPNEAPQHRTYVRDFWIERDKVTNLEFARFLNAWGTKRPEGEHSFDWDDAGVRIHGPSFHRIPLCDLGRPGREMRQ